MKQYPMKLDSVSTEIQQSAIRWLDFSKSDLEAASFLVKNGFFRHAIYHLQQSVEKACKSYALFSGIMGEDKLKHAIGHKPTKLYLQLLGVAEKNIDKMNLLSLGPRITVDEIKFVREQLMLFSKNPSVLSDEKVSNFIERMKEFEETASEELMKLEDDSIFNDIFKERLDLLDEAIRAQFQNHFSSKQLDVIIPVIQNSVQNDQSSIRNISSLMLIFRESMILLLFLTLITQAHAIDTRYPTKFFDPMEAYSEDTILIKNFNDLEKLLAASLNGLFSYYSKYPIESTEMNRRGEQLQQEVKIALGKI